MAGSRLLPVLPVLLGILNLPALAGPLESPAQSLPAYGYPQAAPLLWAICYPLPAAVGEESACPYLRQACRRTQAVNATRLQEGVLENLKRLERARDAYRRGEAAQAAGDASLAHRCYEEARKVCPGSRYESLAAGRLAEVGKDSRPAEETAGEEQEPPDCSISERPECRVGSMLEEAQRAYADGRYGRVRTLAFGVLSIDPLCAAARGLVEKCHRPPLTSPEATAPRRLLPIGPAVPADLEPGEEQELVVEVIEQSRYPQTAEPPVAQTWFQRYLRLVTSPRPDPRPARSW